MRDPNDEPTLDPSDSEGESDDGRNAGEPSLLYVEAGVPLASLTTLEVGGPARVLVCCDHADEVVEALEWCRDGDLQCLVIGGGSNILASDAGFDGMALQLTSRGIEAEVDGDRVRVWADAGVSWDFLVEKTVGEGWAGIECLSGIPGSVGAAPIQNIGAYGQELSETLEAVEVLDRATGEVRKLPAEELGLGYRMSHLKSRWRDRFVVLRVFLELDRSAPGAVRYPELARRLGVSDGEAAPMPQDVRKAVLDVRREKSMVWDEADPNHRSAGSFFVNPVLREAEALAVAERARVHGVVRELPRYAATLADGTIGVKLSAAWLIEESGFSRGHVAGDAGLSSRHCLALINRGRARSADLVSLASTLRRRVRDVFGVTLEPEPVFVGFDRSVSELLDGVTFSRHDAIIHGGP